MEEGHSVWEIRKKPGFQRQKPGFGGTQKNAGSVDLAFGSQRLYWFDLTFTHSTPHEGGQ